MNRITALFLSALLLFAPVLPSASAEDAEAGWVAAYREILSTAEADRLARIRAETGEVFDILTECSYALYDIDKDDIPELIVKTGTCEADYTGAVYTFTGGSARFAGEMSLSHSGIYSYPDDNGVIRYWGHMGYACGEWYQLSDGRLVFRDRLFEDDLNSRLPDDYDAEYIDPATVIPGALALSLQPVTLSLPLTRYDEVRRSLDGQFTVSAKQMYPLQDPMFFDRVISENREVCGVRAHIYANSPGPLPFQDLLKKDAAAGWMGGDLHITEMQTADLNGDGQLECVVQLTGGEGGDSIRFYLSEQNGTVYAYIENYASESVRIDRFGNLLMTTPYSSQAARLIFDGPECFLLVLPEGYFGN